MTREEIAAHLGIVPNSVRGKVQKGQIERKIEDGRNLYRLVEPGLKKGTAGRKRQKPLPPPIPPIVVELAPEPERPKEEPEKSSTFNPKQVLLDMLASIRVGRNIDAIEKGDEIDLATGEISRELDAKISMRQHRQLKEIEDALERVRLGEYGLCEDCGEPIPEQRLRLFPAARLCVRCQEEMDQFEKIKESQGIRTGIWREEGSESTFSRSFED
ncbi:MAG: TraR/DksA family transcriptional regulator [Deltaproteobacteria bacterium]|nr:TraR/DksA family transcriptional regulator [Deltaproteobacteria bacterium]